MLLFRNKQEAAPTEKRGRQAPLVKPATRNAGEMIPELAEI